MRQTWILLLVAAVSLCGSSAIASSFQSQMEIARVSHSKLWLRLLHYKTKWFRKPQSLLVGPGFFFSPRGKTDPEAELLATLDAFRHPEWKLGKLKQSPQCAFPARFDFLTSELHVSIPRVKCAKLDEFLRQFDAEYPTLVFSAAYPNNPGSMFGHTFLKFKSSGNRPDLSDYSISYAAHVGDENQLLFMYKGLFGGYPGEFSMLPYYEKINEYVNSESRDLWEYDLNISKADTERMLKHLWEIETNSWFDYYFVDENCSYQLLAALEVARPDWDLTDFGLHVIPAETVKRVVKIPGAVRAVRFRPSLRKRMLQRYYVLTSTQRSVFSSLVSREISPDAVSDVAVLESADTYFQYLKQREGGKLSINDQKLARAILIRRSEIRNAGSMEMMLPAIPEDSRPDKGHYPYRLGTAGGVQTASNQYFQELEFKVAYHDLLNDDLGYSPFSQLDFPGFTLRYVPNSSNLNIEEIRGVEITSLFPLNFLEKKPSWRLLADYYSPKDFGCLTCHVARVESGGGATFNLFSPHAIFYVLGLADVEGGSSLAKGYRFDPRVRVATLFNPVEQYKLKLEANWVADLFQNDREPSFYIFDVAQSYSFGPSWEARIEGDYYLQTAPIGPNYREAKLVLNRYF